MATKEVTFQNYNAETGEYFTDTKTCTVIDSSYTKETLGSRDSGGEHWYVVDSSINLGWFNVRGNVHLILSDGCTLTADKKSSYYSAVNVEESDSFTIYGQTEGTGKLVAKGGYRAAGIGGDKGETNGTVTINGGIVEAYGGTYGAGIGGGYDADGKNITINGGKVTAEGGSWGAGIGGGDYGYGYNITINGGIVNATAEYSAAGIGGGFDGQGHDITINGGTVSADGDWSAGIGGGYYSTGYNITINGGTVTATGHNYGAGIGGGDYKAGHDITINGGDVTATGANWAAGIGGGYHGEGYNIFINGGTVTANGGYEGAGIGGGYERQGYNITITGGTVNATGDQTSAGIGGAKESAHDITISGGEVTAKGGARAAGIGNGSGDSSHTDKAYNLTIQDGTVIASGGTTGIGSGERNGVQNITIDGGTITATGELYCAAIGGSKSSEGGTITINGGTITATGGGDAAGIGGGYSSICTNITICGGVVTGFGGNDGSGIGGGQGQGGDDGGADVTILGGLVNATGGEREGANDINASGIGSGAIVDATRRDPPPIAITIDGGTIYATGGHSDSSGIGVGNSDSTVIAKEAITVKAGTSSATETMETITHTDTTNIHDTLRNKQYTYIYLSNDSIVEDTVIDNSATFTRCGGVVGNGGYYNVTSTGSLTNTDCIVIFDGTSTTGNGGAIYNECTVTLANATFSECHTANGSGGAIFNQGGTVSLVNAVFDTNASVYGGGSASGGAIFTNGGTLNITGGGATSIFENNESWHMGGAIGLDGGAAGTLDDVILESNTSRSGGAIYLKDSTLTVANTFFKSNAAKILGINGGLGGAAMVSENGTLNLSSVTFDGNTATSGGAVYTEAGGKVNLTGGVYLNTATDTIINEGTLNWDLAGTSGSTGYLNDYSLLSNGGNLTITVNPDEKFNASYTLASNATSAAGHTFTLTGVGGEEDKAITVGGDTVNYNNVKYALTVNASNELTLDALAISERIVVTNEFILSNFEVKNLSYPDLDGGVFMVESTGSLTVVDSVFTTNESRSGGAIYNDGKTTLSNATFNGNTASDSASGALYNAGTLTLDGTVTLSSDSDTIYNSGALVWNITTTTCGYLSDWSKLTNAETATFTITGMKDNKCGQYTLAGYAASAIGKEFTLKVGDNEKMLTVGGEIVDLNGTYYGRLSVNSGNNLILTVETKRIVVQDGETFTIQDGMVLNGDPTQAHSGEGGIFQVDAGGTLTNDGAAAIREFSAQGDGGAIMNYGTVSLSHMRFSANQSGESGGAISCHGTDEKGDALLELAHAVFSGNSASYDGGAVHSYGSRLTITDSVFARNHSSNQGGAIFAQASVQTLTNVAFNDNYSTKGGGGIYVLGDDLYLENVLFNGNRSAERPEAGAILNNEGNLHLTGNVTLATESDTIYNYGGSISWRLDHGKNGYISNYALVTTAPDCQTNYAIDAENADVNTSCILAGNAATADLQSFTLFNGTVTVNGDSFGKDGKYYTLYTDGDDDLRLSIVQRMVVDGIDTTLAEGLVFTNNGTAYDGDGGSIEVKNGGTLFAKGSESTPFIFRNSAASGNGGAVWVADGTAELGNAVFSGNGAGTNGGAIFNQGTINLSGTVELSTDTDTWHNATNSRVNWNLSSAGIVSHFERYANADPTVTQTITVGENPTEGDFVLAKGDMTGHSTDSTGKYSFRATINGETLSDTITVGDENPVVFEGYRYSLSVDDNGTPDIATDDDLVLTVERNFGVEVDPSLQDKWFKAGETVTLFGGYISDGPTIITVGGQAATLDTADKTWTYTYADHADTVGTPVRILCKSGSDVDDTFYTLKVDTVAPRALFVSLNDEEYAGEWKNIHPDNAVVSIVLFDRTSGIQEDSVTLVYDGVQWTRGTEYTYDAETGEITTIAGNIYEGAHVLTVTANDNAGNEFAKTVDVRLDITAPTITVAHTPTEDFASSVDVTAEITDGDSGVNSAQYTLDGTNWTDYQGTFAVTSNGVVTFKAIDNAGNESIVEHTVSNIDADAPVVTITADTVTMAESVTFSVNATDACTNITRLEYSIDGGVNWTQCAIAQGTKSVDAEQTATVNHTTYLFRAYDQVGNTGEESVTFDNIYDGTEDPFEVVGEKVVPAGTILSVVALVMNGDARLVNNGSVDACILQVSGTENLIEGNDIWADDIELAEGAELEISKNQFDAFMAGSEFVSDTGKLLVSSSEGNSLRTRDIEAVMEKDNLSDVEFEENLVSIKDLKLQGTKKTTISFLDGYGTSKNDTIRFYQDTNITFGSESGVIDLKEGSNLVQIDKNAKVVINSGLANVSTVKSAADSDVKIGAISFQDGRSATLRAEGEYFQAGNITGAAGNANAITIGRGTEFASGDIRLGGRNDTITANKGSKVGIGSIQAINENQTEFTGARIDFGAGNDQLNAGGELFATGAVDFGNGNDKLIVDDGGMFFAAERWVGDMADPENAEYAVAEIKFGDGNDILATGKHSYFGAGNVTGVETIALGEFSHAEVGDISGVRTFTIEGGSSKNGGASLVAGEVSGTTENDLFDFGSYNKAELAALDFGKGNDTLKLGTNTRVDITGKLDFGEGNDKLSLGKDAVLSVAEFNVDSLDAGKLSMGKNAYLVIADADDLADAKNKWSKYSNQIVAQLA